jgi:autotransporter-associated beta strand protein
LGAPTTVANGTIALGATSTTGVLKYTGAATSTDRVINLNGTTGGATIDQSGNGLLKFTSAFTTTGRGSKTLTLTGSTAGTGEVAGAIVNAASGGTALATAFVAGASTVTLASVDGVSIGASITGTGIAGGTTVTAIDTGTKTVTLSANTTGTSGAVGSTYNVTGVLNLTSLTKNGSGTWTLSATNTFTGGVTINAGTLKLGNNSVIADAISSFTINGGTFDLATFVEGITAAITLADGTIAGTNTGFLLARGGYAGTGTNTISKRLSVRAADANSGLFNISSGTTTVSGIIYSDDSNVQGITKTGGGTLILGNAANSYTGATTINGGTLALDATGSIATSTSLAIAAGATLDTNSQTNYAIPAAQPVAFGIDATGSGSSGKITAAALDISSATVTYNITGTPDDPVYVLATYTSLSGTPNFLSVPAPPTGYTLNYAYEGNKIALVQTGGTTYADWLVANAPATGFDTDTDKDGIPNGVENVLGSNPNTYNAGLTEVSSTASSVVFKHTLNPTIASDVTYTYQWSTDLVEWKASTETNTGGTTATISPSAPVSGVVTVTITITGGPSSKLFGRLIAVK